MWQDCKVNNSKNTGDNGITLSVKAFSVSTPSVCNSLLYSTFSVTTTSV